MLLGMGEGELQGSQIWKHVFVSRSKCLSKDIVQFGEIFRCNCTHANLLPSFTFYFSAKVLLRKWGYRLQHYKMDVHCLDPTYRRFGLRLFCKVECSVDFAFSSFCDKG